LLKRSRLSLRGARCKHFQQNRGGGRTYKRHACPATSNGLEQKKVQLNVFHHSERHRADRSAQTSCGGSRKKGKPPFVTGVTDINQGSRPKRRRRHPTNQWPSPFRKTPTNATRPQKGYDGVLNTQKRPYIFFQMQVRHRGQRGERRITLDSTQRR